MNEIQAYGDIRTRAAQVTRRYFATRLLILVAYADPGGTKFNVGHVRRSLCDQ